MELNPTVTRHVTGHLNKLVRRFDIRGTSALTLGNQGDGKCSMFNPKVLCRWVKVSTTRTDDDEKREQPPFPLNSLTTTTETHK